MWTRPTSDVHVRMSISKQVAAQPEVGLVFRDLLMTSEGCELYVRDAREYSDALEQSTATFGELENVARHRGETLIG